MLPLSARSGSGLRSGLGVGWRWGLGWVLLVVVCYELTLECLEYLGILEMITIHVVSQRQVSRADCSGWYHTGKLERVNPGCLAMNTKRVGPGHRLVDPADLGPSQRSQE